MSGSANPAIKWRGTIVVAWIVAWASVASSGVKPDVMTNSVAGTTWEGPESTGERTSWTFEEDGMLSYKTRNGSYRNGTWTQTGNAIYFETNKRYAEYQGEFRGDIMQGRASNITKKNWTWQAKKLD